MESKEERLFTNIFLNIKIKLMSSILFKEQIKKKK